MPSRASSPSDSEGLADHLRCQERARGSLRPKRTQSTGSYRAAASRPPHSCGVKVGSNGQSSSIGHRRSALPFFARAPRAWGRPSGGEIKALKHRTGRDVQPNVSGCLDLSSVREGRAGSNWVDAGDGLPSPVAAAFMMLACGDGEGAAFRRRGSGRKPADSRVSGLPSRIGDRGRCCESGSPKRGTPSVRAGIPLLASSCR